MVQFGFHSMVNLKMCYYKFLWNVQTSGTPKPRKSHTSNCTCVLHGVACLSCLHHVLWICFQLANKEDSAEAVWKHVITPPLVYDSLCGSYYQAARWLPKTRPTAKQNITQKSRTLLQGFRLTVVKSQVFQPAKQLVAFR